MRYHLTNNTSNHRLDLTLKAKVISACEPEVKPTERVERACQPSSDREDTVASFVSCFESVLYKHHGGDVGDAHGDYANENGY